jgi:S1-C subfamily serine protease
MDPALRPPRLRAGWFLAFLLLAFAGGAASGALVSLLIPNRSSDATEVQTTVPAQGQQGANVDIPAAVASALPSVVTVINEQEPRQDSQGRLVQSVSVGSGVIIDDRGYVVTNEHVIDNPGKLSVVLESGEQRPAALVSSDAPFTDLAVLRIPAGSLKAIGFADSAKLKLGETVIAVGSALFEYRNSVTVGVVSGLGRRYLRNNIFMEDLIQTDAAINNGNSGGPLLNTSGRVVGITTNVVRRIGDQENVQGIAFAISSRTIQPIVQAIIDKGSYPRPYIGIDHLDLDETVASDKGLPVSQGALVQRVVGGSPAEAAGLQPGDVILRMGRYDLNADTPFLNALERFNPKDKVPLLVLRNGRQLQLTVEVALR